MVQERHSWYDISITIATTHSGNFRNQRIVGVGVSQQGANRQQHFGDSKSGRPLVLQNIQTDAAGVVNIAMVNLSNKLNFGCLKRVVGGEMNIEHEHSSGVWGVIGTDDVGLPVEEVLSNRTSRAVGWRILLKILELLCKLKCTHIQTRRENGKQWASAKE